MELCVLHYHYRPGGVRQVIAAGLPALVCAAGFTRVHLAAGEAPDAPWREEIERALHPVPVQWTAARALGYWSETQAAYEETADALTALPADVLWAHNLSVGRNFHLARALAQQAGKWPAVWLHHHDWWWDGRWQRWPELLAQGAQSLAHALRTTLPAADHIRHFCLNARDASLLYEMAGVGGTLIGNPVTWTPPSAAEVEEARAFLSTHTGGRRVWLYPCRALRRKNIAEALLMQRALDPEACVVTTGGPSSADEITYYNTLRPLPGLHMALATGAGAPPVPALLAAAHAITVTSLQEGFGLPYYEAALARRPLYARLIDVMLQSLPRVPAMPLAAGWTALPLPPDAYDAAAETQRTTAAAEKLAALLPEPLRDALTRRKPAADFGELTLTAQLEVLRAAPVRLAPQMTTERGIPEVHYPPEAWVQCLLLAARRRQSPPRETWETNAADKLRPLVRQWLARPLLWNNEPRKTQE